MRQASWRTPFAGAAFALVLLVMLAGCARRPPDPLDVFRADPSAQSMPLLIVPF